MKLFIKLISMLLAVMMVLSAVTVLFTVDIFAEEDSTETETGDENTDNETPVVVDHLTHYFATPDEKLATMKVAYEKGDIRLYVDSVSGEVAYVNTKTGEKLFTNPYDVASTTGNEATKQEILSQLVIEYKRTSASLNDPVEKLTSFADAADRGQITIENISGGIRVEYGIGREQTKMLVPRLISMERFEEMILKPLLEVFGTDLYDPRSQNPEVFDVQKMLSYYMVYSVDALDRSVYSNQDIWNIENTFGGLYENLQNSDAQYARALKKFPIIETMDVYVFDTGAGEKELARAEEIITKYCPEYTYEELEYDHILTEYKSDDTNPPFFRMALEYKVQDDGLSVTLPANGIRFNEALYTLETIQILPYMGAGNTAYDGYNFFPDGSGALFDFKGHSDQISVEGKVYGDDFTRSEIIGKYQNTIRYPVFGVVEETVFYNYQRYNNEGELAEENIIAGNIVEAIKAQRNGETVPFCNGQVEGLTSTYGKIINAESTAEKKIVEKRGFLCVVEEGDALASISTINESDAKADYSTVKVSVTPRPKDKYKMEGSNDEIPVVSKRKYVGNYTMKYIPLSDPETKEKGVEVYDASWFGMAVAYRDYLQNKGIIKKLSSEQLTSDIPLYIETFGTIETTEKILSIPVTVMAPLTTFENVATIYKELAKDGMKNINFKLTGYANGGMEYTIPGNLKFERAVGGNKGFQELLDIIKEENKKEDSNFGVFPDFDFAYVKDQSLFSGYSALIHNARTIDDRYASKKEWSPTQQKYENYFEMVVSPAYFAEFYEKLTVNYAYKYDGETGISVSTLGTALNSDFDDDEPYNREDSKQFTIEAFDYFNNHYREVMTDGGNAYTWKYIDHMLGVALDSSRYNFASRSVPFIGVVLHGSMRFAGTPLNMEGDMQYAMLKAIENGASPYFILSYQNTNVLKEDEQLSKYYSIRYDIWGDDIKNTYSILNDVLGDVQNKYIVGHEFLTGGTRIPDADELMTDILLRYELLLNANRNAAELLEKELQMAASTAREDGRLAEEYAAEAIIKVIDLYNSQMTFTRNSAVFGADFYNNLKAAYGEYCKVAYSKDPEVQKQMDRIEDIYDIISEYNLSLADCERLYDEAYEKYVSYADAESYKSYKDTIASVYKSYADGEISKAQLEYSIAVIASEEKINVAMAAFKKGDITNAALLDVIGKYGAALVDTEGYDAAVNAYLSGNMAYQNVIDAAKYWGKNKKNNDAKEAFLAAIDAYTEGTLADPALTAAIDAWYEGAKPDESVDLTALNKGIADFKANRIDSDDLSEIIGMYFFSQLDKAELLAIAEAIKVAKPGFDNAEMNYLLDPISDEDLAELKKAYNSAKSDYQSKLNTFKNNQSVSRFESSFKKFNEAKLAYERGLAMKEIDKTDAEAKYLEQLAIYAPIRDAFVYAARPTLNSDVVKADVEDFYAKVDAYNKYLSAKESFNAAIYSGFAIGFDDCYDLYYNKYSLECYKDFGVLLKNEGCLAEDREAYYQYYDADVIVKTLEDNMKDSKIVSGSFDNYLRALAVYDYLSENRATLEAADKEKFDSEFARYENMVKATRRTALTNTAAMGLILTDTVGVMIGDANLRFLMDSTGVEISDAIASTPLKTIQSIYNEAREHVARAEAAIDVLARSENNYQIKYLEGKEETLTNIDLSDPDMPFVVKQAVERAQAAYYYIEEDSFEPISDGFKTEYTHNGKPIYQSVSNSNIYFYGTYEEGYQYVKKVEKNGEVSFVVYDENLSNAGGTANGNRIYENTKKEFGNKVYFTIAGGKMTYYTKVSDGVFVEKAPIVYNGEFFATDRRSGNDIYKDGDVYYSVDAETGEYTRYTYNQCIRKCYEEVVEGNEYVMGIIAALQKNEASSDNTVLNDIIKRFDINERISKKNDDEVEIDEGESKYSTDNIVAVTFGNSDGKAYKTILLNYNNYDVNIEYKGIVYTIPAYYFVIPQ